MRVAVGLLLLASLLAPHGAAQPSEIKYRFMGDPGLIHVDDKGQGETRFTLWVEFSRFACALPVDVHFEVRVEPVQAAWANSTAHNPSRIRLLPPGPHSGSLGQSAIGRFVANWATDAPRDARQEYVVRATPIPPDFSSCSPKPPIVQGFPDHWNVTVCREPHPEGLGAGCKELRPMGLGGAKRTPGLEPVWPLLAASLILLRRQKTV